MPALNSRMTARITTEPRRSDRRIRGDITTPFGPWSSVRGLTASPTRGLRPPYDWVSGGHGRLERARTLLRPRPARQDLGARPASRRASISARDAWQSRSAPAPCGGGGSQQSGGGGGAFGGGRWGLS